MVHQKTWCIPMDCQIALDKMKTAAIKLKTEDGEPFEVPEDGSLGLLALGHIGLKLWREKRRESQNKNKETKSDHGQT